MRGRRSGWVSLSSRILSGGHGQWYRCLEPTGLKGLKREGDCWAGPVSFWESSGDPAGVPGGLAPRVLWTRGQNEGNARKRG